ncbi:hypothetical protein [Nocardioides sp.]|uniref:hypothetical protein n=1 Tax=Nocardioides sp. TaxID=35761 RepID=UPI001A1CF8FE|nr:hypothetical protein [Nocardioides sp.]MBJ7359955.1 hypothetical protein [Nocardioides sp.]
MTPTPHVATPRPVRGGGSALPGALVLAVVLVLGLLLTLVPSPATGAAKVRHDLTVAAEEVGGEGTNHFRMFGAVPTYQGRRLKIQHRVDDGGWRLWKTTLTAAEDGAFSERIYGGKRGSRVCYKVVVPATKKYRTTKRKVACITTS